MLDGFGTVVNALGICVKPYLTQIVSTILWQLNNKSAMVQQQVTDLTTSLAVVIKQCGEDQLLSKLGLVLFEQLGEEYPDTSICPFACCQLLQLYREVLWSSRCPFCSPHQSTGARTQSRVCSTVAIAIVAETCGPFTCIPAILNEYRTAELNMRTGTRCSLDFMSGKFAHYPPHSLSADLWLNPSYYWGLILFILC